MTETNNEPEPRETLLTFECDPSYGRLALIARPQNLFKPRGLMLWDVGALNVEAMLIGRDNQVTVSFGSVPARWFAQSANFEQVVKAFAEGKEPARSWGTWDTIYPGIDVRIIFDGDADKVRALMWGHTPERPPFSDFGRVL